MSFGRDQRVLVDAIDYRKLNDHACINAGIHSRIFASTCDHQSRWQPLTPGALRRRRCEQLQRRSRVLVSSSLFSSWCPHPPDGSAVLTLPPLFTQHTRSKSW
jgi:hypothetical protein